MTLREAVVRTGNTTLAYKVLFEGRSEREALHRWESITGTVLPFARVAGWYYSLEEEQRQAFQAMRRLLVADPPSFDVEELLAKTAAFYAPWEASWQRWSLAREAPR